MGQEGTSLSSLCPQIHAAPPRFWRGAGLCRDTHRVGGKSTEIPTRLLPWLLSTSYSAKVIKTSVRIKKLSSVARALPAALSVAAAAARRDAPLLSPPSLGGRRRRSPLPCLLKAQYRFSRNTDTFVAELCSALSWPCRKPGFVPSGFCCASHPPGARRGRFVLWVLLSTQHPWGSLVRS